MACLSLLIYSKYKDIRDLNYYAQYAWQIKECQTVHKYFIILIAECCMQSSLW